MPRKPRIDCPGLFYHVIARGIERGLIFKDDKDNEEFLARLGEILKDTSTFIYAFALIPNHFHLLLQRGATPVSTVMQRLLTGYAIYFNKRHRRSGHLFQNRYKSIICEHDTYFLELLRYIHLNPLRAGLAQSISSLKLYPYSGHTYILGIRKVDWFYPDTILSYYGKTEREAKGRYMEYIAEGASMEKGADLVGGGLRRSLGYPNQYPKEKQAYDERVLGSSGFVEEIIARSETLGESDQRLDLGPLISSTCERFCVTEAEILGDTKKKDAVIARAYLASNMQRNLGLSTGEIARSLSVTRSAVSKMIKRRKDLGLD